MATRNADAVAFEACHKTYKRGKLCLLNREFRRILTRENIMYFRLILSHLIEVLSENAW